MNVKIIKMKTFIYQKIPLTIVACVEQDETKFGVTKFGFHKGEKFDETLGIDIATHRTEIQPYTVLNKKITKGQFDLFVIAISSYIRQSKQWSPNLKRI